MCVVDYMSVLIRGLLSAHSKNTEESARLETLTAATNDVCIAQHADELRGILAFIN